VEQAEKITAGEDYVVKNTVVSKPNKILHLRPPFSHNFFDAVEVLCPPPKIPTKAT
jgi:hypothetical protein